MKVTYIYHSCYLVELKEHTLLFDYFEGELPKIDKPLYIFSSHFHHDHFDKKIYDLDAKAYVLSKDINKKRKKQIVKDSIFMKENETTIIDDLTVHTLQSTDEGVAFIVEVEGQTIFHAGDLNNWAWAEEGQEYMDEQERNYKTFIEPLRDYNLDIGFMLLDPRLEDNYAKAMLYFIDTFNCKNVFPMHMWKKYEYCNKFIQDNPNYKIHCLEKENQEFEI